MSRCLSSRLFLHSTSHFLNDGDDDCDDVDDDDEDEDDDDDEDEDDAEDRVWCPLPNCEIQSS